MYPAFMFVMFGVSTLIVWVGAHRIDDGFMRVGQMTAFITYTMQIIMSFIMLTVMAVMIPRAAIAAKRVDEVIRTRSSINNKPDAVKMNDPKGTVEFENVCFTYPGADGEVLTDISFTAEAGKTVPIGQKTYEKTYGKQNTDDTSISGGKDTASNGNDKGGRSGDIPASGGKDKGGKSGDIPASGGKDKGSQSGDDPTSGGKNKGGRSGDIPSTGGKDKSGKTGSGKNSSGKGVEYEIAGASAAGEVSGKIWSYEKDIPFGKVHAEALSAEAHGKATATLYARDTGDKIFADPRVEASAGVTLCALSGSASAHVGGKKAGITGTVDASVGKAEATVKVTAGLRDKNGGLDPHLSGKASAELTAAEANASLKASVPGVDATVTAGAKVGLGAHANVTIGGGKIHCDVGAAVGVGANVGVDVNASGAVKAICDLAKAVGSVFTG